MYNTVPLERVYINDIFKKQSPRKPNLPDPSFNGGRSAYLALQLAGFTHIDLDDCMWAPLSCSRYSAESIVSFVKPTGQVSRMQVAPAQPCCPTVKVRTFDINVDVACFICAYYSVPEIANARSCGYWVFDHDTREWVQKDVFDQGFNFKATYGKNPQEWEPVM